MTSRRTLIQGGQVYDHDGDVHKPAIADILIEDDKIVSVGHDLTTETVHEIIDASGRLIVPGLINAHYHSHDTLSRR
jgi:cytosine/adenosine deaminase-related metal-dependent hydrolase